MLSLLYHTCIALWSFQLNLRLGEHTTLIVIPSSKIIRRTVLFHILLRPPNVPPYSSYARALSANEVVAKAFACLGRACRQSQTRRLPHGITTAFIRITCISCCTATPLDLHSTPPCHHQGRGTAVREPLYARYPTTRAPTKAARVTFPRPY
jgi:hypothetical protein